MRTSSSSHTLLSCEFVRKVWMSSPIRINVKIHVQLPFRFLCGEMLKKPKEDGAALFALIAWSIWKPHNLLIFKNKPSPPEGLKIF